MGSIAMRKRKNGSAGCPAIWHVWAWCARALPITRR